MVVNVDVIREKPSCQMNAPEEENKGVEEGEVSMLLGVLGELRV